MTSLFSAVATLIVMATPYFSSAQITRPLAPRQLPAQVSADAIPAGTTIHIRLRETVSSFGSKADMPVSALVIQPVLRDNEIVIPLGTQLAGTIVKVRRIGLGFASETATVDLRFDQMRLPGETGQPVSLKLTQVDNSRETVDANGTIHGIRATASASKVLSGAAISAASFDPMSLLFGLSASLSAFRIPESEIILPVGTELTLRTSAPISVSQTYPDPPLVTTGTDDQQRLIDLAKTLPYRTETELKHEPSDITSIMFLGDEGAIIRALDAAGWSRSDALGTQSNYGVMRSVVENQGYKEGPVSTLLLADRPPVGAWAKTLDTFFQRHHLRLFAQGKDFDGKTVFVTSATHDSGIGINKATKTLIHIIDENIDAERTKVVSDMLLTGCVEAVEYIDRPWIPEDLRNATGDTLRTDRRMAVIKLDQCTDAKRADDPDPELRKVREKAVAPERIARDGSLYLRDDVYRGNIAYQGYSAGKMIWGATHKKKETAAEAASPKTIIAVGEPYVIVSRPKVSFLPQKNQFRDPGSSRPSFYLPGERRKTYQTRLEYSISGGYSRFVNRDFSSQQLCDCLSDDDPNLREEALYTMALHSGFSIAPRATIDSWRYVSNEFGYTYNSAALSMHITDDTGVLDDLRFDGQVRQFSYNTLLHVRPNGARFRPYAAVGPVFQLLRLYDAQPSKDKVLQFTIKDAGLIVDAYNFGHKPPLEGGGIFQFGIQYGGGYKYQLTPRLFVRGDYRETISPQPDYWTKSYPTILAANPKDLPLGTGFVIGPQHFGSALHQRLFTTGVGISF